MRKIIRIGMIDKGLVTMNEKFLQDFEIQSAFWRNRTNGTVCWERHSSTHYGFKDCAKLTFSVGDFSISICVPWEPTEDQHMWYYAGMYAYNTHVAMVEAWDKYGYWLDALKG